MQFSWGTSRVLGMSRNAQAILDEIRALPPWEFQAVCQELRRGVEAASQVPRADDPIHSARGMFEGRRLNEAFFHWITTGRPFVLLKMAMTLDGRIATAGGESQWITGPPARARVQRLRQGADAILVGGETVRRDDPALMVRTPQRWWRQPRKLVWTRRPPESYPAALKIWADPANPPEFAHPATAAEWDALLRNLGGRGVTALLVEGGGELAGALLRAGAVNRVEFHVASKLLGGRGSRPVVGGPDPAYLTEALPLRELETRRLGEDVLITGLL